MTQSGSFTSVSCAAVESAGRQATVVRHAGAASDHVLSPWYPEGNYLTNLTLLLD